MAWYIIWPNGNILGASIVRHENRQFDIRELQLPVTRTRPSVVGRTDIGNAEITHTIFGRARVRVIRKQDEIRRAWLLAALAATATVAAAWLGWIALQKYESFQNAIPHANLPSVSIKPNTLPLSENNNPAASQRSAPQQPLGLKAAGQIAEKPLFPTIAPTVATPPVTKPVTRPAANKPAAAVPLAAPLIKEDTSTQPPLGDNQLSAPINAQP